MAVHNLTARVYTIKILRQYCDFNFILIKRQESIESKYFDSTVILI
jgi:hypothetical protein